MASTRGEIAKLEELQMIVSEWIVSGKYVNYLLDFRRLNDTKWVDKEVVCYFLREDVFDQIEENGNKLTIILSISDIVSLSSDEVQVALSHLTNSLEKQLNSEKIALHRHDKLCGVMEVILWRCENLLSHQTRNRMFDYLMRFIERLEKYETTDKAIDSVLENKFDKYKSLLLVLINSMGKQLQENESDWSRHRQLCNVLNRIGKKYNVLSTQETCELIFDYLMKLIEKCEDEETIDFAFGALIQLPYDQFSFKLYKYEPSLLKLLVIVQNPLSTGQIRHKKQFDLCHTLKWNLKNSEETLNEKTYNKIFDFYMVLINQHEENKMKQIFSSILSFPFHKNQSILLQFIDLVENKLNETTSEWERHIGLCEVMQSVFAFKDWLSDQTLKIAFDYLLRLLEKCDNEETIESAWNALRQFPFYKNPSLLLLLIDIADNKLNEEQCRHGELFGVIDTLLVYKNLLNDKTLEKIFNFILKLIETCEHKGTIASAWNALSRFPFDKHQSLLLNLIDLVEKRMIEEQLNLYEHEGLCGVMNEMLAQCGATFNQKTLTRMFEYLKKVIVKYDDWETLYRAWTALTHFPLVKYHFEINKYESSLQKLIEFLENQLKTEQFESEKHAKLCAVMDGVLWSQKGSLSHLTSERLFNYLVKLMEKCDHNETIYSAIDILRIFPFDQHENSLLRLFDLVENQLNKSVELYKFVNEMFHLNKKALSKEICDRIFDYFQKNKISQNAFDSGYDTSSNSEMSFKSGKSSTTLTKLIILNNQLSAEQAISEIKDFLISQSGQIKFLFSKICEYLTNDLKSLQKNHQMHHNWCTALIELVKSGKLNLLSENAENLLFEYLLQLLEGDNDMETTLLGILLVEQLILVEKFKRFQINSLKDKLNTLSKNECQFESELPQNFDFDRYQVEWCARWCVENLVRKDIPEKLPLIKLSHDRFGARNDTDGCIPVRSSFAVISDIFFYEVILIAQEGDQIGWSTRNSTFNRQNINIGDDDDEHYIAFDVRNKCIVDRKLTHQIVNNPPLQSPNVVGCLIDVENRKFVFYLNGKMVASINKHFSTLSYYPSARLGVHQQYYFNFGQKSFKYTPQDIHYNDFCKVSNGDVRKFQLVDTEINNDLMWFKHPVVDNQVDLFYEDLRQHEHDEFVQKLEYQITNIQTHKIDLTGIECTRFIQSVIEVMQTELNDDEFIREILTNQLSLYKDKNELASFTNKMFELIYPYTQLQFNSENKTKCHNLGIILISILNLFPNIPTVVYQMSLNFLLSTKLISIETLRRNAPLVNRALTGFDAFRLDGRTKRMLLNNPTFILTLKSIEQYGQLDNISRLYEPNFESQVLQAGLCAKWLYDQVVSGASESPDHHATLNPTDRSAMLKLSSDRLSARSDFRWQSVRSIDHNSSTYVYTHCCYFEVILLTDGPMRIGWATKRTDLNESQIGKDHLSISFDGFTRAVRHQGEVYQQLDIAPWKVGDVVGCFIDKTNGQFSFSLNGQPVSMPPHVHFSSLPYHAAVSLSPHQQVYFNFGQAQFKYGPQDIDYWDFQLALSYRENHFINSSINFRNAQLSNALISVDSTVTNSNISFTSSSKSPVLVRESKNFKPNKKKELDVVLYDDSIQSSSKYSQPIFHLDSEPHISAMNMESSTKESSNHTNHNLKFTHKWTIENVDLSSNKNAATSLPVIYSKSFTLSKLLQFSLRLLPNCSNNDQIPYISLFLYLENNLLENYSNIPVNYKISIVNLDGEIVYFQEKTDNFQQEESWGWENFIEKDRLREFLQNHQLSLVCDLSIDSTEIYSEILNKEPISLFHTENSFDCNKNINRLTYVWKIENFTLYFYDQQSPKYVKSETFPSQVHESINRYNLRLWPKGIDEESKEFVSLYLTLETSEQSEKISVQYRISVLNRRGQVFHTGEGRIYSNSDTENCCKIKGSSKFLPLEQIINPENGLLPKDILTIYCEIWEIMDHEIYEEKILDENESGKMCVQ